MAHAYVKSEAHCARCAYDIRGLPVEGRCPECGLEVWVTLRHLVDPAASRLPKLRDPVGVGNALVWLVFCMSAVAVLVACHALMLTLGVAPQTRLPLFSWMVPHDLLLVAALIAMTATWSVIRFRLPWRGEQMRSVHFDVWLVGAAVAGMTGVCLLLWNREGEWAMRFIGVPPREVLAERFALHAALATMSLVGWVGLQGILNTIGKRSRAYRTAEQGRQNIRPMIGATMAIAAGSGLRILGTLLDGWGRIGYLGTVIVWVSALMVLIGLGYLLVNALWIRKALLNPPPQLEDLILLPPGQPERNI